MNVLKDRALLEAVRHHLMQDQRLAGQMICVSSCNGFIVVAGCVDSEEHRQLALDLASGVMGVKGVEARIDVRNCRE